MSSVKTKAAGAILLTLERLFILDSVTHMASVELWVLLTTVLLVWRFLLDFSGPWFGKPSRMFIVLTLEMLNHNLVIYTMGLMQLSGARVNDYFQVWAVLLVTLQYSVKIGRPYTRSKQVPLLDLMSSFWSANLIRVQTFNLLRIPLWLIWSLNAVRIIVLFVTSSKGETENQESMRLVSDYMSYEDSLPAAAAVGDDQEVSEMSGCKYLVYGEHRVLKELQERRREGRRTLSSWFTRKGAIIKSESHSDRSYKIQLDPDVVHKDHLVTVEKIWHDTCKSRLLGGTRTADPDNQRKDLCLSFALYKLLRRRFYDLPVHELTRPEGRRKIRKLVFDYILKDCERAFRITGVELSFLQDLFYSKHAAVFAGGLMVPLRSLLLSLSLAAATGYIAYPARYIPERMDPADRNRITHGVFITRLMVGIIVLKELLEIFLYVFSRWAKVLMLCKYVQNQRLWRPLVEKPMRFILFFGNKAKWSQTISQQNLLVKFRVPKPGSLPPLTWRMVLCRGVTTGTISLKDYTKIAILNSLKNLKKEGHNYLNTFKSNEGVKLPIYFSNAFESNKGVKWPNNLKQVDTHIILVWHIATSLCEIEIFDSVKKLTVVRRPRPFVQDPNGIRPKSKSKEPAAPQQEKSESVWSEQYATAVSLSNYCMYLVRKALVPDNPIVAGMVLDEVIKEIDYAIDEFCIEENSGPMKPKEENSGPMKPKEENSGAMKVKEENSGLMKLKEENSGPMKLKDVYDKLMDMETKVRKHYGPDVEAHHVEEKDEGDKDLHKDLHIECSLTMMGAVLGKNLTQVYAGDAAACLWTDLANFWMGFLLHLAVNTRAATHRKHLAGDSELITHLWALLSHAGFRGNDIHGEQGLDQEDIPDIDQAVN